MSPLKGLIFSHLMFARLDFSPRCPLQSVRQDPLTEFSDWSAMRNHNITEKMEVPLGEKKGWIFEEWKLNIRYSRYEEEDR